MERYAITCDTTPVSNAVNQFSRYSNRQTKNVTPPAMIWFLVVVEMNSPMASRHAALQNQAEIGHQHRLQIGLAPDEQHGDVEHRHAKDAEEEQHRAQPLAEDDFVIA